MSDTNEKKNEKKEKCFIIMPISDQGDYPEGHFTKVYEQIIKPSVEDVGYEAYRVDENNICDSIINKIFDAIQKCPMAICDLSNRNPNVLYELGLRQAYDKPVVLIQDDKTQKIFDVAGIKTVFYKSTRFYEDVMEAREKIKKAILATKEGEENTLAKVIKVNAADFSQIEVSQEDKINIILAGIYSELRELKNKGQDGLLGLVSTELKKSSSVEKSQNFLEVIIECDDFEMAKAFADKLNSSSALSQIGIENENNSWRLIFIINNNRWHINALKNYIYDVAVKFNVKVVYIYCN